LLPRSSLSSRVDLRPRASSSAAASAWDGPAGGATRAKGSGSRSAASSSSAPRRGRHPRRSSSGEPARSRGAAAADRDQLTVHEPQVALIVANGASYREAAAALFLSPKTIEFHLTHVYRKLVVRTRTELSRVAACRGLFDDSPSLVAPQKT
jgi:DNA-binding CsgD family transcriptional regulator